MTPRMSADLAFHVQLQRIKALPLHPQKVVVTRKRPTVRPPIYRDWRVDQQLVLVGSKRGGR